MTKVQKSPHKSIDLWGSFLYDNKGVIRARQNWGQLFAVTSGPNPRNFPALIAEDSCYCDQCGKELHMCPNCHQFGRGNFCRHCGCIITGTDEISKDESAETEHIKVGAVESENENEQHGSKEPDCSQSTSFLSIKPIKNISLKKIDIKI